MAWLILLAVMVLGTWQLGKRNTSCGVTFGALCLVVLLCLVAMTSEVIFELTPIID